MARDPWPEDMRLRQIRRRLSRAHHTPISLYNRAAMPCCLDKKGPEGGSAERNEKMRKGGDEDAMGKAVSFFSSLFRFFRP